MFISKPYSYTLFNVKCRGYVFNATYFVYMSSVPYTQHLKTFNVLGIKHYKIPPYGMARAYFRAKRLSYLIPHCDTTKFGIT